LSVKLEVACGYIHRELIRGLEEGILSNIPHDVIGTAGMPEVAGYDRIPPAKLIADAGLCRTIYKMAVFIFQESDGHPFACQYKIRPAVVIKIGK